LPLRLSVRTVDLACEPSDSGEETLHRNILGKAPSTSADTYSLTFKFEETSLSRQNPPPDTTFDKPCLITISSFSLSTVVHHWPRPWISSSPSNASDVNDSLLAVRLLVHEVKVAEHVHVVQALMASKFLHADVKPTTAATSTSLIASKGMPRFEVEAHIETICGSLAVPHRAGESESGVITLSTSALVFHASSHFHIQTSGRITKTGTSAISASGDPCVCNYTSSLHTDHVSVTATKHHLATSGGVAEPLLLVDPLEISVLGSTSGFVSPDHSISLFLDSDTSSIDAMLMTDGLSIELWHAGAVEVITQVANAFQAGTRPPKPVSGRPLGKLPFGVSAKLGIRRFTLFLTSPDLNPDDNLQLSRGIAAKTSLAISYSAFKQTSLAQTQQSMLRGQLRQKLKLPEERIIQASAAARASKVTNQQSAFLQLAMRQVAVRAAAATPYAADDPYYEAENAGPGCAEILRMPALVVDVTLRSQRTVVGVPDICGINVSIPTCQATLQLSDAYHILLAIKRISMLSPAKPAPSTPRAPPLRSISVGCTVTVANMEALVHLPANQRVHFALRGMECRLPSSSTRTIHVARLLCYVHPKMSDAIRHEFGRIDNGTVHLPTHSTPLKISVDGGLRIRAPHSFVFNDLVRSIGVAVKGLKHLSHVVKTGSFKPLGSPTAEGPKSVQLVQVQLRVFVFEIADDPIESRLSLLWRAGFGAAKVRMERDEAFLAKVAAINGESECPNSQAAYYQFDERHSISVMEARDRLLRVHALDWLERHRTAAAARSDAEEFFQKEIWGDDTSFSGASEDDLTTTTARISSDPPLLRFVMTKLHLNISPPSFDVGKLPDFLFERGNGMPKDTEYSLLIPLHIHLSLGSARLSARGYPLPLLNIPKRKDSQASMHFDSDLVIAEEMGSDASVDWVDCDLVDRNGDIHRSAPFSFKIPKTIMPVKTYADPVISVQAGGTTDFTWGVSYAPVTQDLLRALETFTSGPRDASPPIGFWDKVVQSVVSISQGR
jgi:hypothetical protein